MSLNRTFGQLTRAEIVTQTGSTSPSFPGQKANTLNGLGARWETGARGSHGDYIVHEGLRFERGDPTRAQAKWDYWSKEFTMAVRLKTQLERIVYSR